MSSPIIAIAPMMIRRAENKMMSFALPRFFAADADPKATSGKAAYDEGGRYGSRLLKKGQTEQFERMQTILGAQAQAAPKQAKTITISILQSLKHLNLDIAYKKKIASYRVKQLGKHLMPLIARTESQIKQSEAMAGDGKRAN